MFFYVNLQPTTRLAGWVSCVWSKLASWMYLGLLGTIMFHFIWDLFACVHRLQYIIIDAATRIFSSSAHMMRRRREIFSDLAGRLRKLKLKLEVCQMDGWMDAWRSAGAKLFQIYAYNLLIISVGRSVSFISIIHSLFCMNCSRATTL